MTLIFTIPLVIGLTLGVSVAFGQRVGLAEVDRQTALSHLRAGQEALATERYEAAEREFREAIRLDPRLELAHYGLGQVFMATKRYPHAIDAFSSCRDLFLANLTEDHDQRLLYERRLDDQLQSKRDELRLLQTGRVRMANPTSSVDRVRTEIAQLERLRQRSRESAGNLPPFILTALGSAYFRTGAFADAEREWRRAAVVDPNIGEIHNNLAVVCMLTGRYEEAEREIELAEKAGFKVSAKLKEDLRSRRK